jgi:hypothetical protein
MAVIVPRPERSSAPAAVIIGSCQVMVLERGSPHASGMVSVVSSAVMSLGSHIELICESRGLIA